jgi:hypothetical protein
VLRAVNVNLHRASMLPSRRPDHLEPVASSAIPVRAGHAADDVETFAPNPHLNWIDEFIAHMHTPNQSDDNAVSADLQGAPFLAFQAGWRLRNARRSDDG